MRPRRNTAPATANPPITIAQLAGSATASFGGVKMVPVAVMPKAASQQGPLKYSTRKACAPSVTFAV